jgi:hypothetical protein
MSPCTLLAIRTDHAIAKTRPARHFFDICQNIAAHDVLAQVISCRIRRVVTQTRMTNTASHHAVINCPDDNHPTISTWAWRGQDARAGARASYKRASYKNLLDRRGGFSDT